MGCGPAGMLAVHALRLHGIRPDILSINQMSNLPGAIYLHEAIPRLTDEMEPVDILFKKVGTQEGYAKKVYGSPTAPVSWEHFAEGVHQGWNLTRAYQRLWIKYSHLIQNVDMARPDNAETIVQNYHVVISSIPAMVMCRLTMAHEFRSQRIYVRSWGVSPNRNEITYDGTSAISYRRSHLFGYNSEETTEDAVMYLHGWIPGVKPLSTTCNCYPRFHRIGRFGKWTRGVLSHSAFSDAISIAKREGLITDAMF